MPGFNKAVKDLYATLTAANFPGASRPPLYFGHAALRTAAGGFVNVPYVVLEDQGADTELDFESNPQSSGRFTLSVYYEKLEDVDAAGAAIRFNGAAPSARAGFDNAPALTIPGWTYEPFSLVHVREVQGQLPDRGVSGQLIHRSVHTYDVRAVKTS